MLYQCMSWCDACMCACVRVLIYWLYHVYDQELLMNAQPLCTWSWCHVFALSLLSGTDSKTSLRWKAVTGFTTTTSHSVATCWSWQNWGSVATMPAFSAAAIGQVAECNFLNIWWHYVATVPAFSAAAISQLAKCTFVNIWLHCFWYFMHAFETNLWTEL